MFFFFKQKTAYEMRISDWSSDVCSSDLFGIHQRRAVIALQAVSLGRGERGPRPVALAVIDEAKLIPGKGIFVVARDGQLQDAPRLFEVRGIFGDRKSTRLNSSH